MYNRITQINDSIRDIVSKLILQELSLKAGVFITVFSVDTSRDLRSTRVIVSIFPEKERAYGMTALHRTQKRIEQALHRKLATKPLPKLSFFLDTSEEQADKVEQIFIKLKNDE